MAISAKSGKLRWGLAPFIDEESGKGHHTLLSRSVIALMILLGIGMILSIDPPMVAFRNLSFDQVIDHLTALALVSLFLERAIEVFVAAWRAGEHEQLQIRLERLKVENTSTDEVKKCKLEISKFKHETRFWALTAAAVAGIMISILGVRSLAAVLEGGQIEDGSWHDHLFTLVDVLITGFLLSGGADAIHKVVSVFTDFMDATKRRAALRTESSA